MQTKFHLVEDKVDLERMMQAAFTTVVPTVTAEGRMAVEAMVMMMMVMMMMMMMMMMVMAFYLT
jgi:hypothetical protein